MRKMNILLIIVFVTFSTQIFSNEAGYGSWQQRTQLGIQASGNSYLSLSDDQNLTGDIGPGFGGFIDYKINDFFALNLTLDYNQLNFDYPSVLKDDIIVTTIKGKYLLGSSKQFKPYIDAEIGALTFTQDHARGFSGSKTAGVLTAGIGAEIPLSSRINLIPGINFNSTINEDLDLPPNSKTFLDDQYINFSLGIGVKLGSSERDIRRVKKEREEEIVTVSQDSLEKLKAKIEEKEENLEEYQNIKEEYSRKINALINMIEAKNTTIDSLRKGEAQKAAESTQKTEQKSIDVKSTYKQGLQLFNQKNYQQAAQKFKTLFKNYPDHKLAGNFTYWAGESYYGMENYEKALAHFNRVEEYPDSPKNDAALIMAGQSLLKLNETSRAKTKFRELLNKYPESEYSKLAENYLNR
ncbi:MAG: tol-pal system protein YbgF [Candidatus Marinimicrobia bacterium]|nr:tol-pal system protein YbgF [Candidatus Neomarinimicrobiota bacterium]